MEAWRSIGRWLSRRTLVVAVGVVVVTALATLGLGRLDFATGQDSYIDPDSQVAARQRALPVAVRRREHGRAVLGARGSDRGRSVHAGNIAQIDDMPSALAPIRPSTSVISPVALLQWTDDLITKGTASEILARTIEREPDPTPQERRRTDTVITTHAARRRR
jgi:hypothetical protein